MDDFEYTQENITRRIQEYIKDNGYEFEDGFNNGIKFSIGLDTCIMPGIFKPCSEFTICQEKLGS